MEPFCTSLSSLSSFDSVDSVLVDVDLVYSVDVDRPPAPVPTFGTLPTTPAAALLYLHGVITTWGTTLNEKAD